MKHHLTHLRVRYAETDQMGIVYYGNYPQYFEIARTEWLRALGYTYRDMEEQGIMLPVRDLQIRYKAPARYDDLLRVETRVEDKPDRRIRFDHKIFNEAETLLTTGSVELVFVAIASGRPVQAPGYLQELWDAN